MRKFLLVAMALLLVTNVVVLAGVAYNRAGEPVVGIELTERELSIWQSYSHADENSGTSLSLSWQVLDTGGEASFGRTPGWLDDKKLRELGLDPGEYRVDQGQPGYRRVLPDVQAIIVLEFDGLSYQQAVASAALKFDRLREQVVTLPDEEKLQRMLRLAEKNLNRMKVSGTRLFAVDAGLDLAALKEKYSEKNKYLFVRGDIGLGWTDNRIDARIERLAVHWVYVPLPYSRQLETLTEGKGYPRYGDTLIAPRYKVRLNIGQRLEPWIVSVTSFDDQ